MLFWRDELCICRTPLEISVCQSTDGWKTYETNYCNLQSIILKTLSFAFQICFLSCSKQRKSKDKWISNSARKQTVIFQFILWMGCNMVNSIQNTFFFFKLFHLFNCLWFDSLSSERNWHLRQWVNHTFLSIFIGLLVIKVKQRYDTINYHAQSVIPGRSRRLSPGMTLSAREFTVSYWRWT